MSDITPALALTVSGGATIYTNDDTAERLQLRADQALYAAKSSGRNCIRLDRIDAGITWAA